MKNFLLKYAFGAPKEADANEKRDAEKAKLDAHRALNKHVYDDDMTGAIEMTGGKRRSKSHRKAHRKSHRKSHRKACRKASRKAHRKSCRCD